MKYLYTLAALLIGGQMMAQDIVLHDDAGNLVVNPTLTVDSLSTVDHAEAVYYMVNTTAGDLSVTWSRTRVAHSTSIVEDQICDDILCFTADDITMYPRPGNFTIAAGDSSILWPKVFPGDVPACAIYTYKVYVGLGALQDSLQVKWRFDNQDCFLSAEEETKVEFTTYPNPASSTFNIQLTTNNNMVDLLVYNILGERIMAEKLVDGLNTVNIESLTSGVYFYSIVKNNKAIETKKLIVRH